MTSSCTDDSCDEVNDVIVNATNDANCDNNLFCDGAETCHATLDCQDGARPGGDRRQSLGVRTIVAMKTTTSS